MKLRTRLALAFLLMSVVPLAAITLYSYNSTIGAFRRAVEAESSVIAADLGKRMDLVTAAVCDRMDQVTAAAQTRDWSERDRARDQRFSQQVAATLGDAGTYLSSLQFTPMPPPAPRPPHRVAPPDRRSRAGGRTVPRPPRPAPPDTTGTWPVRAQEAAPTGGTPPQPPAGPQPGVPATPAPPAVEDVSKIVIDLPASGAIPREARAAFSQLKDLQELKDLKDMGIDLPRLTQKLGPSLGAGFQEAARAFEKRAQELEKKIQADRQRLAAAEQTRRAQYRAWTERIRQGKPLDIPVQRDGRVVGTMNAEISLDKVLESVLAGRSTESGEIAFAVDLNTNRLYTSGRRERATLASLPLFGQVRQSKNTVQKVSDDDWVVVARRESGFLFGIARPIGSALGDIRRATGRNLGFGMLAVLVALVGIFPISTRMTRNLSTLHAGVERIAKGDLTARVPVRSKDEIGTLGLAFNKMAQDLDAHQKVIAERERLRGELELCRQLQAEMLPKQPLRLGFADIKGVSMPAREVGGDFFNYFLLPRGEVAVLVGDVSGKGVGAALLMANVQATLRARLSLERDLATLADAIDHEIDESTPKAVYLTLFMGILDSSHHVLRYVNAGHNPQFVLRANGGIDRLASTGLPIAMFAGHGYAEASVTMNDGDLLFFYTDGITEVENEQGEMFGSERLETLLVKHHEEGVDALLAHIEEEVARFRGAADQFDDATMMVLRIGATPVAAQAPAATEA